MALNFPAKIYQILENESSDVIKWLPNGAAFRIVDHGRFEREIIPKYFRHNQLSSVQRQLNLYGFKCISRGEDKGAFFHSKFRRGDWEVVKKINRYAPIKKSDDKSDDPTRPEEILPLPMSLQHTSPQIPVEHSQSKPIGVFNASSMRPPEHSSGSYHPLHPPAQSFPPFAHSHMYHHRPSFDPYFGHDVSPFATPHGAHPQSTDHSNLSSHSMYHQGSPPPPPSWMWGAPPSVNPFSNSYALHMKQFLESSPEYLQYKQAKQQQEQFLQQQQQQQTQPLQQFSKTAPLPLQHSHIVQSQQTPSASIRSDPPSRVQLEVATSPIASEPISSASNSQKIAGPLQLSSPVESEVLVDEENSDAEENEDSEPQSCVVGTVKINPIESNSPTFVNVMNQGIVLIDPDFDLDEEFDFLKDIDHPGALHPSISVVQSKKVLRDVGVNTDITLMN